ncbi:hypothetical protein QTP86_025742, partial [Hemibagrus guttatus]
MYRGLGQGRLRKRKYVVILSHTGELLRLLELVCCTAVDIMAQEFVQARIKGDKVVVFLKPTCPYCVLAKDLLSKYSFKPGHLEFIDISGRDNMGAIQDYFQQITGARTFCKIKSTDQRNSHHEETMADHEDVRNISGEDVFDSTLFNTLGAYSSL